MMRGNDAVTLANREKASLLTADTVNVSFQGVGGRVNSIQTAEQKEVKSGDILMTLDTTDIDLQISQLQISIQQQEVKIQQALLQKVRAEDLEKQLLLVSSAQDSLDLAQSNYDRSEALFKAGALSQANFDTVSSQFETAKNNLAQQQTSAKKLQAQNETDSQNYVYNVDLLNTQKETLMVQLQALELQKQRMTLVAPADGKVTQIIPKVGENISQGATVAIIQSGQLYYNLYVDETQVSKFQVGGKITGTVEALNTNIEGTVRTINAAPLYANMRMSREKGQSDISTCLIRIDVPATPGLLPGMTVEVNLDEGLS